MSSSKPSVNPDAKPKRKRRGLVALFCSVLLCGGLFVFLG